MDTNLLHYTFPPTIAEHKANYEHFLQEVIFGNLLNELSNIEYIGTPPLGITKFKFKDYCKKYGVQQLGSTCVGYKGTFTLKETLMDFVSECLSITKGQYDFYLEVEIDNNSVNFLDESRSLTQLVQLI